MTRLCCSAAKAGWPRQAALTGVFDPDIVKRHVRVDDGLVGVMDAVNCASLHVNDITIYERCYCAFFARSSETNLRRCPESIQKTQFFITHIFHNLSPAWIVKVCFDGDAIVFGTNKAVVYGHIAGARHVDTIVAGVVMMMWML